MASNRGSLHLGGCPVDFVRKNEIAKQWTLHEFERAVLFEVDLRPGQIGGQEVRGKLNAAEVTLDELRERLDGSRLGSTGKALHEYVAVGQQSDEQSLDDRFLADDRLLNAVAKCEEFLVRI